MASLCFLLAAGLTAAAGAAPGVLEVTIDSIDPSDFPILDVRALIVDQQGWTLRSLDQRHLALFEDDRLLKLIRVELDKDPVSVVLALDSSGTMTDAADELRAAAGNLLRLIDPMDRTAVLEFDGEPRFISRFGQSREKAIRALRAIVPYGPTALYDSVYRSLLELSSQPGRRNVVVMSDGKDQNKSDTGPGSRRTARDVVELARKLDIPVHAIAIGKKALRKELAFLSKETGGSAYFAPRASDLQKLYRRIGARLKGRIRLVARSLRPELDASLRELTLRVRAGESFGEDRAPYHAPGRWVVDVGPVGYRGRKPESVAERRVVLRDVNLAELEPGDPESLGAHFDGLFTPLATQP